MLGAILCGSERMGQKGSFIDAHFSAKPEMPWISISGNQPPIHRLRMGEQEAASWRTRSIIRSFTETNWKGDRMNILFRVALAFAIYFAPMKKQKTGL